MERTDYRPGLRSRLVGYLKIALPLLATGLMSTVFLFQQPDEIAGGITFSEDDRDTMRDGLAVYSPKFSGLGPSGNRFFVEATKAVPDSGQNPNFVSLVDLSGRTEYTSGLTVNLRAARGRANLPEQVMELEGGLRILTSNGYEGLTNGGSANLETGTFQSSGPVTLTGPIGTLEAGVMQIVVETLETGKQNQVFTFEKGVKLTLNPK